MPLTLRQDLKAGGRLCSLGELGRMLNLPESRIEKAVERGAIQPLGVVGRNILVVLYPEEIEKLQIAIRNPPGAQALS